MKARATAGSVLLDCNPAQSKTTQQEEHHGEKGESQADRRKCWRVHRDIASRLLSQRVGSETAVDGPHQTHSRCLTYSSVSNDGVATLRGPSGDWRVMSQTVHEIRNAIRAATGRFEREFAASFTKEELQAICETLDVAVDEAGRPSTSEMRQQIRVRVGIADSPDTADDSTFRKADLQAIAEAVGVSSES